MPPKVKGVVSRHLPSWYRRQMYGGTIIFGGANGQITYAELFNGSTSGGYITVWSVNFSVSVSSNCVFEWYQGQKQTNLGGQAPIFAGGPAGYGVVGGFHSATCIGTEFYNLATNTNVQSFWPHNYPCAVIPPGYSFGIHTNNANVTLTAGWMWVESADL